MWVRDEAAYIFGPIFIHPEETDHEPTKMFYKKEVFLSNLEETCPMTCIGGNSIFGWPQSYVPLLQVYYWVVARTLAEEETECHWVIYTGRTMSEINSDSDLLVFLIKS